MPTNDRYIYVPSVGRAGRARTLDWVDPHKTVVAVREEELRDYVRAYPKHYFETLQGRHVGQTRRNIIRYAGAAHVQIDDDIVLTSKLSEPMDYVEHLWQCLDTYSMTGVSSGYRTRLEKESIDVPVYCIYGLSPKIFSAPIEYFPLCEDKILNIYAMAANGTCMDNTCIFSNASFNSGSRGYEGGCFEYRTKEMIYEVYDLIGEIFKRYVSVQKINKPTNAHGFEVNRRLRIAWKRLRKESVDGIALQTLEAMWRNFIHTSKGKYLQEKYGGVDLRSRGGDSIHQESSGG